MESDTEETEMKIEYHKSYEVDPLSENSEETSTENEHYNVDDFESFTPFCDNEVQNEAIGWHKMIDSSGRYICRYCDLAYSTVQTLRYHVKTKHPENFKQIQSLILNNKRNKKIKCHICKSRFKQLHELSDHFKQYHNMENVKSSCNLCDATFKSEKEKLEHLYLKHKKTDKKNFICTLCGYRTLKKSHFNQHKNTHSNVKNYSCNYCEYQTNYLPNLTIHKRIHNNDKPHYCDYNGCTYHCATKSGLKSHQLRHNKEENLIYCDKCSYKTVYKQSLKKHIDSHRRNCIIVKM